MKKNFVYLLLAISFLLAIPQPTMAQNIPDEGEEIVVDVTGNNSENGPGRILSPIPLTAIYYHSLSCLEIYFLYSIGDVTITLTNLTTGGAAVTQTDSGFGGCLVPVTLGSGFYRISFVAQDGASYEGYFTVF